MGIYAKGSRGRQTSRQTLGSHRPQSLLSHQTCHLLSHPFPLLCLFFRDFLSLQNLAVLPLLLYQNLPLPSSPATVCVPPLYPFFLGFSTRTLEHCWWKSLSCFSCLLTISLFVPSLASSLFHPSLFWLHPPPCLFPLLVSSCLCPCPSLRKPRPSWMHFLSNYLDP